MRIKLDKEVMLCTLGIGQCIVDDLYFEPLFRYFSLLLQAQFAHNELSNIGNLGFIALNVYHNRQGVTNGRSYKHFLATIKTPI